MDEKAKHRILLVDDVASMRRIVSKVLEKSGYLIDEAEDGVAALEMLNNKKKFYHLVLLDVMMPRKDGISLLKEMRENEKFKNMPVVMITAKSERADIMKAAALNVSGYLLKPFNPEGIIKKVAEVLQGIDPTKPVGGEQAAKSGAAANNAPDS